MPNIKGTWQWLDNPALEVPETIDQTVSFNSNGESFERIEVRGFIRYYYAGQHTPEYVDVTATGETWAESGYKYVDFGEAEQAVSDDFYTYFMANAFPYIEIQLGSVYPVTLLTKGNYLDKNIRVLPSPTQEPTLEQKTVTPTTSEQVVTPSQGYDALSQVTVRAVPTEKKTVTPTENQQTVTPSEGKFLSDVTVQAIQATEEDIVENGEYTPDTGTYYKKVNVNVQQYTDISSTTAQADDVLEGKYFFPYNNAPRTEGTIPIRTASNPEFTAKNDSVTFQEGYYPEASTVKIAESEKAKIIPDNIKEGISILGIQGNYAGNGLDINGAINEYVVNAGANVNAGDFVEFITKLGQSSYYTENTGDVRIKKINNNRYAIMYNVSTNDAIYLKFIDVTGSAMTVGEPIMVINNIKLFNYTNWDFDISPDGTKLGFCVSSDTPRTLYLRVYKISGNSISLATSLPFSGTFYQCSVKFSSSHCVFAAHKSNNSIYLCLFKYDRYTASYVTNNSTYYKSSYTSCFLECNSRGQFIAYGTRSGTGYISTFVINSNDFDFSSGVSMTSLLFGRFINDDYFLAIGIDKGKIVKFNDSGLTNVGSEQTFGSNLLSNNLFVVNEEKAISIDRRAIFYDFNITNGTITKTLNANQLSVEYKSIAEHSGNVVLAASTNGAKLTDISYDVNNNSVTENEPGTFTYVQPATTRDNYVGVAKTGGTSGQTVEVFEVPFSYTVTVSKSNCTNTAVTSPMKQSETQTITFTANTAYELPENITVTNCEYTWNNLTGALTITNLTGNVQITVNATVQKLAAPVIALNGSQVSWNTVPHATSYGIFADNTPFGASTATTSVDLSQYEKAMGAGVKSITVNAQGSPYAASDMSNAVSYTVTPLAAPSVTFVPTTGQLVWAAIDGADSYTVYEQTSSSQWQVVTTTTATYATIDYSVGTHTMAVAATSTTKVDSDRSAAVAVVCRGINLTLSNVTGASSNPTKMFEGTTETLTFTANDGYTLPDSVSITGATVSWNKDTGTLTLSNPTNNITGTITGVQEQTGYTVTITGTFDWLASDQWTAVKFNTPPTSENDFDYICNRSNSNTLSHAMNNNIYNSSFVLQSQPVTATNVSKVYFFSDGSMVESTLNGANVPNTYFPDTSEYTLTQNSTIVLNTAGD